MEDDDAPATWEEKYEVWSETLDAEDIARLEPELTNAWYYPPPSPPPDDEG